MPSSSHFGLPTFMGVSMNTQGLCVEKANSKATVDQSVMRMSEVNTVSFDEKSRSKNSSSSGTSA